MKLHTDGTKCLEGTQRVPKNFEPCCEMFDVHTYACALDVRYEWWKRRKQWVIAISESAGGGGITMNFCPHCGAKLDKADKDGETSKQGQGRIVDIPLNRSRRSSRTRKE